MPQLNVTVGQTTFQQIYDQFSDHRSFTKGDQASLRLTGTNLHTKSGWPSGIGQVAAERRAMKKEDALNFIRSAINNQFRAAGFEGNAPGAEILNHLGITDASRVTVRDLANIKREVDARMNTATLERTRQDIEAFHASGLDGMASPGVNWKVSSDGSGGVIFARDPLRNDHSVVLKFDPEDSQRAVGSFYRVMDGIRQLDANLPFSVPHFSSVPLPENSVERQQVMDRINECHTQAQERLQHVTDPDERRALEKTLNKTSPDSSMGYVRQLNDTNLVAKFEMIQNAQCIHQLPLDQRVGLLSSEQFARDMGKTMVLGAVLGLNDHVTLGSGNWGATNFTNLMMDDSQRMHVIDIAVARHGTTEGARLGQSGEALRNKFTEVITFLKNATENPNSLRDTIAENLTRVSGENFFPTNHSPVESLLFSILDFNGSLDAGSLFGSSPEEVQARNNLPESVLQAFTANVMQGMLEGLQFLSQHQESLTNLMREGGDYALNPETAFSRLNAELQDLDVNRTSEALSRFVQSQQA